MNLRKTLRWTWLAVAAAVLYAGGTILMRWRDTRAMQEQALQQRAESDRKIVDQYGGGEMKVLAFYANPPVVKRGAAALLCYGVAYAKSVRIEPSVEAIQPSLSRCVEVKPSAATTYTLTATDEKGRDATRTVEVAVR